MQFLIGLLLLLTCVIVPFMLVGGNVKALIQPAEFFIIVGAAISSFIIANPKTVISHTLHDLKLMLSPKFYKKSAYIELLKFIFNLFKKIQAKGLLSIEKDLDNPKDSELFSMYPSILGNKRAITFCCDYLRILSIGLEDKYQMEELMSTEIDVMLNEDQHSIHAIQNLADSFPALGIVAAVLGVIKAMSSINEPPEILGEMIGGALVGTFLGVLCAYGMVGPMAHFVELVIEARFKHIYCIKSSILAYMQGNSAQIIAEIARKEIPESVRPTFTELEGAIYEQK